MSVVAVFIRFWSRIILKAELWWDDWLALLSLVRILPSFRLLNDNHLRPYADTSRHGMRIVHTLDEHRFRKTRQRRTETRHRRRIEIPLCRRNTLCHRNYPSKAIRVISVCPNLWLPEAIYSHAMDHGRLGRSLGYLPHAFVDLAVHTYIKGLE